MGELREVVGFSLGKLIECGVCGIPALPNSGKFQN